MSEVVTIKGKATTVFRGIDAYFIDPKFFPLLKEKGFDFIMIYLKNLTQAQLDAAKTNKLVVGIIWEVGEGNSLAGAPQGAVDGKRAFLKMQQFNIPKDVACFTTTDTGVSEDKFNAVWGYNAAFDAAIWPTYKIGAYAEGDLLVVLKAAGLQYTWLPGAMGWQGSRAYHSWDIAQGATIPANTNRRWVEQDLPDVSVWPALPFDYDPNVAYSLDWGIQP